MTLLSRLLLRAVSAAVAPSAAERRRDVMLAIANARLPPAITAACIDACFAGATVAPSLCGPDDGDATYGHVTIFRAPAAVHATLAAAGFTRHAQDAGNWYWCDYERVAESERAS